MTSERPDFEAIVTELEEVAMEERVKESKMRDGCCSCCS